MYYHYMDRATTIGQLRSVTFLVSLVVAHIQTACSLHYTIIVVAEENIKMVIAIVYH